MIPQAFKELAPQIVERLEYLQRRVDTVDGPCGPELIHLPLCVPCLVARSVVAP
jgi:hypothetical protein